MPTSPGCPHLSPRNEAPPFASRWHCRVHPWWEAGTATGTHCEERKYLKAGRGGAPHGNVQCPLLFRWKVSCFLQVSNIHLFRDKSKRQSSLNDVYVSKIEGKAKQVTAWTSQLHLLNLKIPIQLQTKAWISKTNFTPRNTRACVLQVTQSCRWPHITPTGPVNYN